MIHLKYINEKQEKHKNKSTSKKSGSIYVLNFPKLEELIKKKILPNLEQFVTE
jgi:hypothetical protein